jgi:myo-inositol-1(or 4)-monophosphatase
VTPPPPLDPHELARLREVAQEAAELGANIVAEAGHQPSSSGELKGAGDYVTEVDRQSESAIRTFLEEATPHIPVLGEEGGGDRGETYWAVDPLDGTTNFLIGFPAVAVSVGLVSGRACLAGAIRAPFLGLSFSAARGEGAWSNGDRLRVSERSLERAIVTTGPPFRDPSLLARYLPALEVVLREAEDVRRPGAAALDLAWVAAGVFDGYFELGLSVWDLAAGSLLVREAGGVVTDWGGGDTYLEGNILAAAPVTHQLLMKAAKAEGSSS